MTTSGTTSFNLNRDQIIRGAARKVGAFASGETPDAQTVSDFAEALNAMVKRWNAIGIHIWTESEATLFLQPNQIRYVFGTGSTDNATDSYSSTATAAAAAAGASTLTVDSISGMTTGQYIGVLLDSGSYQWTTINGAPSGTTVTLTDVLTDSVAEDNTIFFYTSKIVRPLRVPFARRYNIASAIDTPMGVMSRKDYRDQPNKTNTGTITQFFYDPRGGANLTGLIFLWPAPPDATNALKFTYYRPIQDFNTAADTPDLPQEWLDTLIFNLAVVMAPEYGVPAEQYAQIKELAAEFLDQLKGWDREPESVYYGVDFYNTHS